jgi:tRNA threonylcarbamoyladenosine biosynthesis protein TsaB
MMLGVETVGQEGGIALSDEGTLVTASLGVGQRHGETLLPAVLELLSKRGLTFQDIDSVVANEGPGSFTGIRIGLAAVLGMAEAQGIPVWGVGCLDIQAHACYSANDLEQGTYLISTVDVRRGEVAWAQFRVDDGMTHRLSEDALGRAEDPCESPPSGTVVTGDGARLVWPTREDLVRWVPSGPERAAAAVELCRMQAAKGVLRVPEPRYLRPADAKRRRS